MSPRRIIVGLHLAAALATPVLVIFHAWWPLFILWTVVSFFFFYPGAMPNCAWFGPVTTRFRTSQREVWLTFDDGPDPIDTPQILALLAKHRARATFFVIGRHAANHPGLIREILQQGHSLGNHTFSHPVATFWAAHPARLAREVDGCTEALRVAAPEVATTLFRAPVGQANFFVAPVLRPRGLRLTGWSARGFDAVRTDPEAIVEWIWRGISPGAIVLLHEGNHPPGLPPVNPRVLELLLDRLAAAGYACVLPEAGQFL